VEWEYACRAGTTGPFNTGNNLTTSQANYNGNYPYVNNEKGTYRKRTTDVGSFESNPWDLYDMHGNVWEWCWDRYDGYSMADQTASVGAASGSGRVIRGGSWSNSAQYLRSALRNSYTPSGRSSNLGFRVVRP
jgi:formylglycine-generating enzyme required for sulfatase activity